MSSSAIYGILILFGAVILLVIVMINKREKDYKIAMEKYERDMEAYNQAVALYGEPTSAASFAAPAAAPAAASAPVAAATPAAAAAPAASSGEVLLSGVDEPTAAMIIAILCNELGQNPAALRFKSITAL